MADVFLILVVVLAFVLLTIVGLYVVVKYQHPDDKNDAFFPKVVVLFGFVLSGATVLLLPLDVANNEGYPGCDGFDTNLCGGLDMVLFWNIFYWLVPIWLFFLLPFSTFYYEADDGQLMAGTSVGAKPNSRIREALKYELFVVIIFGLLFLVTYLVFNETNIPVRDVVGPSFDTATTFNIKPVPNATFQSWQLEFAEITDTDDYELLFASNIVPLQLNTVKMSLDPSAFYAGLLAFLGWFVFAIFGGIGIAAVPLDLILSFVHRPQHMDPVEFAEAQQGLRDRVNDLVEVGELMKTEREEKLLRTDGDKKGRFNREARRDKKEEQKSLLQFKQAVYLLDQDAEDFQNCSVNFANYNPLLPYASLAAGIAAVILSLFWVMHIILYVLPEYPVAPFLNTYFKWFDAWFPLFGVLSVAVFSFYLLACAVKGCFKFGLRFLFFQVHPMRYNRTYMSSFLFNCGLVLLCALPVVQFSATAFQDYARYTTINQVFNVQVKYLKFFGWFWRNHVFVYALLCVVLLTAVYLGCRPNDSSKSNSEELRERLRARRG